MKTLKLGRRGYTRLWNRVYGLQEPDPDMTTKMIYHGKKGSYVLCIDENLDQVAVSIFTMLKPYRTPDGLYTSEYGKGTGNGVLYASEALVLDHLRGFGPVADQAWRQAVQPCVHNGLLCRHPDGGGGQEGPDDYIGFAVAAYFSRSRDLAESVLKYGRQNLGFFNNENPGGFRAAAWMWRFPQIFCLLNLAAHGKANWFQKLYSAIVLAASGRQGDADSYRLAWLMSLVLTKESALGRLGYRVFKYRLRKAHPEGIRPLIESYYGYDHPIARLWPEPV